MDEMIPRKVGLPDVVVVGRRDATRFLRHPATKNLVRHAISITDVPHHLGIEMAPMTALRRVSSRLHLQFDDVMSGANMVTRDDIARLVRFCEKVAADPGLTLVHCEQGISRSAAAAYILFAVLLGPGEEVAASDELKSTMAWAVHNGWRTSGVGVFPNARMVELADAELDRGGALVAARRSWLS